MPDLYSRDLLSEPLRQLGHVLLWVRHRDFLPDEVRARRWARNRGESRVDLGVLKVGCDVTAFNPNPSHRRWIASAGPSGLVVCLHLGDD